jgi:succinate dehydrogenase / fumarate reductase, membrane anchor subunit
MAATTTPRPSPSPIGPEGPRPGPPTGRGRPLGGLELWMWLFMRISGLLLLFLAVGHVAIMHLPAGGVERIDFGFVALRWQSPLWRTWDWALLMLALIHGINGLRNITLDYVKQPGVRFAINVTTYVIGFFLMTLGTVIVVTFDPSNWPGAV